MAEPAPRPARPSDCRRRLMPWAERNFAGRSHRPCPQPGFCFPGSRASAVRPVRSGRARIAKLRPRCAVGQASVRILRISCPCLHKKLARSRWVVLDVGWRCGGDVSLLDGNSGTGASDDAIRIGSDAATRIEQPIGKLCPVHMRFVICDSVTSALGMSPMRIREPFQFAANASPLCTPCSSESGGAPEQYFRKRALQREKLKRASQQLSGRSCDATTTRK